MLCRIAVTASLILFAAGASRADDIAAAKLHYERGTNLYDLQRYLDAAKEYEAAFEAKPDPALLFNIAQAYRFGGEYSKAIAAYRSYLRRVPGAENREEIDRRILELQKLSDEQKHNRQTPPTETLERGEEQSNSTRPTAKKPNAPNVLPPTPPRAEASPGAERPSRARLLAGISVAALGVVAIGIGAALEGLAGSTNDSLSHPAQGTVFDPNKERTLKNDETAGAVLLGIGGAAAITGAVIAILSSRQKRTTAAVVPSIAAQSFGAIFHATF